MSDLISRSKLIEEIKSLSIVLNGKQIFSNDAKDTVLRIINEQPTAYSGDKVVEELEEKQQKWKTKLSESDTNYMDNAILKQYISHYDIAIEIVRKGGVADD